MPTQKRKPANVPPPKKSEAESVATSNYPETNAREKRSAGPREFLRGAKAISSDWEWGYVPESGTEKVKRLAQGGEQFHDLSEAVKLIPCKPGTLRSFLSRNKADFPPRPDSYRRGPRGRKIRFLTTSEIDRIRQKMLATRR